MPPEENQSAPEAGVETKIDALPGETVTNDTASVQMDQPAAQIEEPATEEEPKAEPTAEQPKTEAAKPEAKQPLSWQERRRNEETNRRREAEAENARLRAELEVYKKGAPPAAPVEAAPPNAPAPSVDEIRRQARLELQQEDQAKAFSEATGRVLTSGIAKYNDFDAARQDMVREFGEQLNARPDFFEALIALDNGHDVFYELAKDPEATERVLSLSPVRLAVEIAKRGEKLGAPPPQQQTPISKAPAPVKPVGGAPVASDRLDDPSLPMDQFAKTFLKQVAHLGR